MASTEAPPDTKIEAPPEPTTPAASQPETRPSPVLAWPAEWPVPELPEPQKRSRAARGLPMGPVLAGAGNATTVAATAAYQVAGPAGVAVAGGVAVATAVAAVARRRASVKRGVARRAGGATGGGGLRDATGSRSGGLGSKGRGGGATSGGGRGAPRHGATGGGLGGKRGGGGKLRHDSPSGRHKTPRRDRHTPGPNAKHDRGDKKPKTPKAPRHGSGATHGLKAAVGRTMRAATKPGSTPRKALAAVGRGTLAAGRGIGRAVKKAWTAQPIKRLRAAARRQAKRLRGAAWDGLRSLLSGVWALLRTRSIKGALTRLRDVWKRRRAARKSKADTAPEQKPAVGDTARRPTATTPATSPGGPGMSGHHFVAPAMEAARIAASYDPTGMLQVGEDFVGLEEALRLNAEAMKVTVENADAKFPLDPQIVDIMRSIHSLQLKAAEMAAELKPAFESLHDVDLQRLRNPRKGLAGERMWDASVNLT